MKARPSGLSAPTVAVLALASVTAAWGSTFFMLKGVVTRVPVTDFLALRFVLAAAVLWALRPGSIRALSPRARRHGVVLGVIYGAGQILQTLGLQHTSASISGFVTGLYVVLTPLLAGLVLRARIGVTAWCATGVATCGLAVMSLQGFALGPGVVVTLISAVLYALHIIGLGRWSTPQDAYGLSVVQMVSIAVLCSVAAIPGGLVLPSRTSDWLALLYMALVAGALALVVQTWAQAHLAATRAAVIMTMEPVFAGLFAVLFGGERFGWRIGVGGALVLGAMYLAELGPRGPAEADVAADVGSVPHLGPV
ncbi:MAG: EamA/RhaT family transporter [Frankiales bacterium]|jgi:drug/metabolite transporter (DMT)-like permease|nr:EamA/RhaT family transporter [Frankiales bacterium]